MLLGFIGGTFLLILFCLFLFAEFIAICFTSYTWAWALLAINAVLAYYFFNLDYHNFQWDTTLFYILAYIGAGIAWSFAKWSLQLLRMRRKMAPVMAKVPYREDEAIELYNNLQYEKKIEIRIPKAEYHGSGDHKKLDERWETYFPKIKQNKTTVSNWIVFWPLSLVANFVQEFIIELVDNIIDFLKTLYDRISLAILGSTFKR